MVNFTPTADEFLWTDRQCLCGILALRAHFHLFNMNTAEAYSLAADPDFLRGRTRRTCGELLPELFDNRPGDELMFGRAECDAQVLIFTSYASLMRHADRTATVNTSLAKYVEALFRLRWSYAQFCELLNVPNLDEK